MWCNSSPGGIIAAQQQSVCVATVCLRCDSLFVVQQQPGWCCCSATAIWLRCNSLFAMQQVCFRCSRSFQLSLGSFNCHFTIFWVWFRSSWVSFGRLRRHFGVIGEVAGVGRERRGVIWEAPASSGSAGVSYGSLRRRLGASSRLNEAKPLLLSRFRSF